MNRPFSLLLLLLLISSVLYPTPTTHAAEPANLIPSNLQPPSPQPASIRDFDLLDPAAGWVLIGQQLFRTADNGAAWSEITPPGAATVWAVDFLGADQGWAVASPAGDPSSNSNLQLSTTLDGGLSWQTADLPLQPFPDLPGLAPATVHLTFVDPQAGWLVFKRPASSNFNLGTLYRTLDGGATWQPLEIPSGDAVVFVDRQTGYVQGGASGTERYQTLDGGVSWQTVSEFPDEVARQIERTAHSHFEGDAGQIGSQNDAFPSTARTRQAMLDERYGWALETSSACDLQLPKAERICTQTQRLLLTTDGGQTWTPLALPDSQFLIPDPVELVPESPELLATGQGFDKCEIASLAALQTWWDYSPYQAVNLYIGGSLRACANSGLSYSYLSSIDRQGWTLIPTWVGRQAACSSYSQRMSYDPAVARDQGIQEAADAVAVADNLKLWNQVIYYDLEAFDTDNTGCLEAAKAFIDGWTEKLHAAGYVAGVYGSPCTSGLPDFWGLANPPGAVWIAHWIYSSYNANANVWSTACGMSDSYWANHQRLRQYTGGHNETWGGVTLNIDSNALDGIVAPAYGQPKQICPRPQGAPAGVILYNNTGYDCAGRQAEYGYFWRLGSGVYNIGGFFQDRASAVYVPAGQSAMLYEGLNRTGGKLCLNASEPDFPARSFNNGVALNDQVSSFEIFAGASCGAADEPVPGESGMISPEAPAAQPEQPAVATQPLLPEQPAADAVPPQVTVTSLSKNGYLNAVNSAPVLIQANLQDGGSGISHAQFFAGYGPGAAWAWQSLGWDVNGSDGWSLTWDASALPDQTDIGVYVFAWDQAGNGAGSPVLHLMLDRAKPTSALNLLPASVDSTRLALSWSLSDNLSGVGSFEIQVQDNGGDWQPWLNSTDSALTQSNFYAQLGHTYGFRMRAIDKAGNQEAFPGGAETAVSVPACSTDSYEPDNERAAAKPLGLGAAQSHTICGLGDADWLSFTVAAGQAYQFATSNLGADTDTLLGLYDMSGNLLAENDDVGVQGNLASRLHYWATADGVVYLRVEHTDLRVAGNAVSYQISADPVRLYLLPMIAKNE